MDYLGTLKIMQWLSPFAGESHPPVTPPHESFSISRSKDVVEPLIKPQWWLNCQDMAKEAVKAVRTGEMKLIPSSHDKTWYNWLDNCRDWCISRQLWWGHRIPAYFVTFNDSSIPAGEVSGRGLGVACISCDDN
jgi:valyl-tRNA synthetase